MVEVIKTGPPCHCILDRISCQSSGFSFLSRNTHHFSPFSRCWSQIRHFVPLSCDKQSFSKAISFFFSLPARSNVTSCNRSFPLTRATFWGLVAPATAAEKPVLLLLLLYGVVVKLIRIHMFRNSPCKDNVVRMEELVNKTRIDSPFLSPPYYSPSSLVNLLGSGKCPNPAKPKILVPPTFSGQ